MNPAHGEIHPGFDEVMEHVTGERQLGKRRLEKRLFPQHPAYGCSGNLPWFVGSVSDVVRCGSHLPRQFLVPLRPVNMHLRDRWR